MKYYPYGGERSATGEMVTDKLFTGQQKEAEVGSSLGLYNYGARFYSTVMGRFLSPDPVIAAPGDPQTLNRYAYVRNNPLVFVDPSGLYLEIPSPGNPFPSLGGGARSGMTQAVWAAFHSFLDLMHERGLSDDEIVAGLLSGELVPLLPTGYASPTWSGTLIEYGFWSSESPKLSDAKIWVTVDLRNGVVYVVYVPENPGELPPVVQGTLWFRSGDGRLHSADLHFVEVFQPPSDASEASIKATPSNAPDRGNKPGICWVYSFSWDPSWGMPVTVVLWPESRLFVSNAMFDPRVDLSLTPVTYPLPEEP